ncbi:hypothetical protein M5D96_003521 [Drosophila gunungcola]|uniref:C2H2-type domain-containing protein n=2 Tax=Drosophila gunungcola TaxID=103775 RepID=A0A9P9YS90_9MUSC|nr:hypothetical protein M5D96_003521 [Drosophila gunungcola]
MRYICQSMSLRNHRRIQSFKCRHCQAIAFAHWRLYRRHEVNCRPKKSKTKDQMSMNSKKKVTPAQIFVCNICKKSFGSLNGLRQHNITHSTERQHKCGICERVFKRRNGLSQHIKGYHLQLKPHECPVCQHRYALKCDMLRCRHSLRKGPNAGE